MNPDLYASPERNPKPPAVAHYMADHDERDYRPSEMRAAIIAGRKVGK